MNFEKTFEVIASSSDANKRVGSFLGHASYRQLSDSELEFRRGSMLGSLTSFSPRKWEAQASVTIQSLDENRSRVSLSLNINTTGQQVTQREIDYLKTEIESFQQAVQTGNLNIEGLDKGHQTLTTSGWKGVWVFLGVTLVVGVSVGLLASLINPSFSSVGVVAGVSAGIVAARKKWGY